MKTSLKLSLSALLLALVCAASSVTAGAAGTVSGSISGSGSSRTASYTFDVDGNHKNAGFSDTEAHQGQYSTTSFYISATKNYTFHFSGASNAGATVTIYKQTVAGSADSGNMASMGGFNIPQYTVGMPSLSYSMKLDAGYYYYVKVISDSETTYSKGAFYVTGVA